jgi:hypothetical protein
MAEVRATYDDPGEARKAMIALERHGIDAAYINVDQAAGMRAAKTDDAMREPDMAVTREVGTRSATTSFIGAVVLGAIGLGVAAALSGGDKTAMLMGGLGGVIVGGLLGMLWGGYGSMAATEEWGESFEARGPVTLSVTVRDGEDVIDLRDRVGRLVARPGDGVAVRARRGVVEQPVDRRLDRLAQHVLPLAGLVVGLGPRQPEDVGEEALGEAVTAHDLLGQLLAPVGEADGALGGAHQALAGHAPDHLRDRRPGDAEPLGDAGLDDVEVVLAQLEDGLAVLLERGVQQLGHVPEAYGGGRERGMADATRELVVRYRDPEQARAAIVALERRGIDADHIHLTAPGVGAPTTDGATRQVDKAVAKRVGRRSLGTSVVLALLLGAMGAVLGWFVSGGDSTAMLLTAAGCFMAGGALGFVYGGYSGIAVSDEWGETFEATGPATLTVDVADDEVIDLRKALETTDPMEITVS